MFSRPSSYFENIYISKKFLDICFLDPKVEMLIEILLFYFQKSADKSRVDFF